MKETNIRRLERAADMIVKAADLIDRAVDADERYMKTSDIYYLNERVRELLHDANMLRTIVKAERDLANG